MTARLQTETRSYRVQPVVGADQPTVQACTVDGDRLVMATTHRDGGFDGDGTVPEISATPNELSDLGVEVYSSTRHARIQNDREVLVNLGAALRGATTGGYRADTPIGLALDDLYPPHEPITISITEEGAPHYSAVVVEGTKWDLQSSQSSLPQVAVTGMSGVGKTVLVDHLRGTKKPYEWRGEKVPSRLSDEQRNERLEELKDRLMNLAGHL